MGASDLIFWNLRFTEILTLNKVRYYHNKELIEVDSLHMFWDKQMLRNFLHTTYLIKYIALSAKSTLYIMVFIKVKNLIQ